MIHVGEGENVRESILDRAVRKELSEARLEGSVNHVSGRRASGADEIERRPWGKNVVGILEEQEEERCRDYGWRIRCQIMGSPVDHTW